MGEPQPEEPDRTLSDADVQQRIALAIEAREKPIRVLLVDDELSICQALSALFGLHGLEVVSVLSAAEAEAALATSEYDVLLIDLRLRDGRGDVVYEAAVALRPELRHRTLFMTGDITAEAERIIASTNCPFLRKPFDTTLAVQAIAALLGIAHNP